jgi:hypothetical protein
VGVHVVDPLDLDGAVHEQVHRLALLPLLDERLPLGKLADLHEPGQHADVGRREILESRQRVEKLLKIHQVPGTRSKKDLSQFCPGFAGASPGASV